MDKPVSVVTKKRYETNLAIYDTAISQRMLGAVLLFSLFLIQVSGVVFELEPEAGMVLNGVALIGALYLAVRAVMTAQQRADYVAKYGESFSSE